MSPKINKYARRDANASEFGRVAKGRRLLTTAFYKLIKDINSARLDGRLTAKLMEVIQSDPIHAHGMRTVDSGDLTLLEGFDFCIKQQMQRTLKFAPNVLVNRQQGECLLHFPMFTPQEALIGDCNDSHMVFVAEAAELDFTREQFVSHSTASIPLRVEENTSLTLSISITAASILPIVVVMGIQLYKQVNGILYRSKPGGYNPLQVMKVEPPVLKLRRMKPNA